MSNKANIYIDQGTDCNISLTIYDNEGNYQNITDYVFSGSITKVYSERTNVYDFIINIITPEEGKIEISMPAEDSLSIEPGKYQYDIILKNDEDRIIKLLEGLVFIIPTIARIS